MSDHAPSAYFFPSNGKSVIGDVRSGFVIQRVSAGGFFYSAQLAAIQDNELDRADTNLVRASQLSTQDRFYRLWSELWVASIRRVLTEIPEGELDQQTAEQFGTEIFSRFQAPGGAVDQAARAIDIHPNNFRNWLQRGDIYRSMMQFEFPDVDAYSEARRDYLQAREHNPSDPSLVLRLAQLEMASDNLEAAREYAEEALAMKSNYANAVFFISQIDIMEGRIEEAISQVRETVVLSPFDPGVRFQLGILLREQAETEQALQAFNAAVTLAPGFSNAWYFLALTLADLDEREQAAEVLENLAEAHPDNLEVRQVLDNVRTGRNPLAGLVEEQAELPIEEELPEDQDPGDLDLDPEEEAELLDEPEEAEEEEIEAEIEE